jgi:Flp pilus assembly protein TadG
MAFPRTPTGAPRARHLLGNEAGAGAVEFALIIPLALLLTFGALEGARAISAQASINHAAKETARFAAVHGLASGAAATEAELEAMALQLAELAPAYTTAAVTWDPDNAPGSLVTVQLQHMFTPVAAPFDDTTFTFTSSAAMTIAR